MSAIALKHGGTVDKFIGDAILIFFGDPETKGVTEDALACLRMAFEMQARTAELNAKWRSRGVEERFHGPHGHQYRLLQCRQFRQRRPHGLYDHRRGSQSRGAAAVDRRARADRALSYETYALVREMFTAHALPAIQMKGISRPVVPYVIDGIVGARGGQVSSLISEHMPGLDLYLDPSLLDEAAVRTRSLLQQALVAVEARRPRGAKT